MVKELQPHYLDLICQAIEAADSQPLLHRLDDRNGVIYATRSDTDTRAEYAVMYKFNGDGVELVVTFIDARPQVKVRHAYLDGIGKFFELFGKALKANRLADTDPRYDHVTCATCGDRYQRIDFRSAQHLLMCKNPIERIAA